jgi:hypothetical protein
VGGSARPVPLLEQITLHRVLDAIYRSAADGKDVAL